jgi:Mn2+/Fe2+ NRAMP family transporter
MQQVLQPVVVFLAALATGALMVNWIGLARAMPDDRASIRARWVRFHIVRTLFSLPTLACYILACLLSPDSLCTGFRQ